MINTKRINVLVVDDSLFFRTAISTAISKNSGINVIGTAASAHEARDKILQLKPDVMTLDVEMPKLNGIEFLKILMAQKPMPVIMVSAVDGIVFDALRAGAVDFVEKPSSGNTDLMNSFGNELVSKILIAANAQLKGSYNTGHTPPKTPHLAATQLIKNVSTRGIIALGASTGGTEATSAILKQLPSNIPGMVITQHMPPVFTKMYAQRLNNESKLTVKEGAEGDVILPGTAFVAPGDKHMTVLKRGEQYVIHCYLGEKVSGHCPSVDVLFDSVAKYANKDFVGILLTGMGSDGAKGLLQLKNKGAFTIGQDEKSSVVYGMPMVAAKLGAVTKQSALENIPSVLLNYLKK